MNLNKTIVLWSVCVSLIVVRVCEGFSRGDVTLACNSMTPSHLFLPSQTTSPPFQILTKKNNVGSVDVLVRGQEFKGFLLQAQNAQGKRVGVFQPTDAVSKAINCDYLGGAIQHSNNSPKKKVIVRWNPKNFRGKMLFRLTVVKSYTVFWTDITSPVLNI